MGGGTFFAYHGLALLLFEKECYKICTTLFRSDLLYCAYF
jgi:hypothetical protein